MFLIPIVLHILSLYVPKHVHCHSQLEYFFMFYKNIYKPLFLQNDKKYAKIVYRNTVLKGERWNYFFNETVKLVIL